MVEYPPVRALDTILLWPFSLQAQGPLFGTRAKRDGSPSDWLRAYADHIATGEGGWDRVANPLEGKFGVEELYQAQQQYAEFVYFHPFVQKLLYEKDDRRRAIEVLVRRDIQHLEVTLSRPPEPCKQLRGELTVTLNVNRMQLFLFTTDLAILAVELELPITEKTDFKLACDLVNQVRRVYSPYFNVTNRTLATADCPHRARWINAQEETVGEMSDFFACQPDVVAETRKNRRAPLVPHWASLIKPLQPWDDFTTEEIQQLKQGETAARKARDSALCYEQLGDERAYAMVRLALSAPHSLPESQMYRLAYLDEGAGGFAYNPNFLREQDVFYDRFWNAGEGWMNTRYATSGYSFIMLVSDFELIEPGGHGPMFRGHFRHHYFFLNLLAVMQRGSLMIFWDRLSNLLREYSTESNNRQAFHDDQRWLSEDFAHYLARFDFSEVSNQIQALELFDRLRRSMRIDQLNREVLDQLRYAREIEESNYEEKSANEQEKLAREQANLAVAQGELAAQQTKLTQIATNWLPLALTFSLLGLSFGVEDFWHWINKDFGSYQPDWLRIALWPLLMCATYWVISQLFHCMNNRQKDG